MSSLSQPQRRALLFTLLSLIVAIWLTAPFVSSGLPYFYNEDEAHHFNRTVNMVKSGSYNPKYFHKPSLHFYLRMPIVASSFLWSVKKGYLKKLEDIETFNPYGLGDYSFTASHPGIVKWNRAFSLFLSLGLVLGACFGAYLLASDSSKMFGVLVAGMVTAVSPSLVSESAKIGVDQLFSLLCLASSLLVVASFQNKKLIYLAACVAGLAVSSKYNALPIVFVPAMAALVINKNLIQAIGLIFISGVFFLIGSPYILVEIPLFLNQIAYEIWHYKIAGHVGHEGTPGLPQAMFYAKWLMNEALFTPTFIISIIGLISLIRRKQGALFLLFPVLFFVLMINQKVNFTRNMTVIIPFLGVSAAIGFEFLIRRFKSSYIRKIALIAGILTLIVQPFTESWIRRVQALNIKDTRNAASLAIESLITRGDEVAVSGELLFPPSIYSQPLVKRFSQNKESYLDLANQGYDFIVGRNPLTGIIQTGVFSSFEQFAGKLGEQRVVENPSIGIYKFENREVLKSVILNKPIVSLIESATGIYNPEIKHPGEEYVWIQNHVSEIKGLNCLSRKGCTVTFVISTPWENQKITLSGDDLETSEAYVSNSQKSTISLKIQQGAPSVIVEVKEVSSPFAKGLSEDKRRLGIAIHEATLNNL